MAKSKKNGDLHGAVAEMEKRAEKLAKRARKAWKKARKARKRLARKLDQDRVKPKAVA
jgi:hypothetical protein